MQPNTNEAAPENATQTPVKKPRGFAALTPEQRAAYASKGGKAAHAMGVAHRFTPEKAKEAGRKGGRASRVRKPA